MMPRVEERASRPDLDLVDCTADLNYTDEKSIHCSRRRRLVIVMMQYETNFRRLTGRKIGRRWEEKVGRRKGGRAG